MAAVTPLVNVAEAGAKDKGLSASPLRQAVTIAAGNDKTEYFTVANYTDKPMTVDLSVKEFSVDDLSYDYTFNKPKNDWVKIQKNQLVLRPRQTSKVQYDIAIPPETRPGGYYFALFASTHVTGPGLPGTVQVTSLLYVTVDGKLIRTSELKNDSIPWFVMGDEITYKFNVKDTGNVYFTAYFYGKVDGLLGGQPATGTGHILMPGKVRTIIGSVPTPLLPGIYSVTYGYRVDYADIKISKTALVLFVPPWSLVALIFVLIVARWLWQGRQHKKKQL